MINIPCAVALAGVLSLIVFSVTNCVRREAIPAESREFRGRGDVAEIKALAEQGNADA